MAPPHVAWDPEYLLELDPRYHEPAEESEDWDSEDILCVLGLCGVWLSGEDRSQ